MVFASFSMGPTQAASIWTFSTTLTARVRRALHARASILYEEFRVYASLLLAEYGQALGGVVNLITKSGTNDFHGSAFEYFRNEKLDTRNYFNNGARPPFRLNQFGGSFGGPILRNKLFFFGNYEGLRQRLGIIQNTFVPTAAYRSTVAGSATRAGPATASQCRSLPPSSAWAGMCAAFPTL